MAESSEIPEGSHLLVAAFDFGTTFSGYAFSFRSEPLKISLNQKWTAGTHKLLSLKTPTCILLDPEEKFYSFGFEAENKYNELAEDDKHHDWLFFRHFKMLLHNNKKLSSKTTVQDIHGKTMTALDIFSMSIRYLRCHFFDELKKRAPYIEESDIMYVITIPAIWDDRGKQFMRLAAIQAEIDTSHLTLALEPEAASIWCQTLTAEWNNWLSKPGVQIMVVDLGGGTADITVHEKNEDGTLKELHKSSGGPWGGMYVDNKFLQWLENVLGRNTIERFKRTSMADYFDMLREFESNKGSFRFDEQEYMSFRIPSILRELTLEETGETFENQINSSSYGSSVKIKRDKIRIESSVIQGWFDGPVGDVITHIQGIFCESNMKEVSSILLVGGFGESAYVQDKIRTAIPNKRLIVPEEAGLAVLKGAVRFGHQPSLLSSRILKYTYGIQTYKDFDETKDDVLKMEVINGVRKVPLFFHQFAKAGEIIPINHKRKHKFIPLTMDFSLVPIFCSPDPNPSFTTDSRCERLGTLSVYHTEGDTLTDKKLDVMMMFGGTELKVMAKMKKTKKVCSIVLNMV